MILHICNFIKSWFYYPKMVRYIKKYGMPKAPYTRFQYALWHCKSGKLSFMGYDDCNRKLSSVTDRWKAVYSEKPIEK